MFWVNLEEKFQKGDMVQLINNFIQIFSDVPSTIDVVCHDLEVVGDTTPCKQHPYRVYPLKLQAMQKEIKKMASMNIATVTGVHHVSKPDGSFCLCTDFRKLNVIMKTASYSIPRIDDCIDRVDHSRYIRKLDLLKG